MPGRKLSPIALKLRAAVKDGKTSYVKICYAADLLHATFMNIFSRPKVSYMTLKSLKMAGLITDDDLSEYKRWEMNNIELIRRDELKHRRNILSARRSKKTKDSYKKKLDEIKEEKRFDL